MDNIGNGINQVRGTWNGDVSPEEFLFGKFFANVDGCRNLMKEKNVFASGSAVLHALQQSVTWEPSDLDLFVSKSDLGRLGMLEWHHFLRGEGYSFVNDASTSRYFRSEVSL